MKRKILVPTILAATILATGIQSSLAYSAPALKKVQKPEEKIAELKDKKIISGYLDGSLKLDSNIKRSEIAKTLVYSIGLENSAKELQKEKSAFKDVAEENWAKGIINVAKDTKGEKNKIALINGYPDGTFRPEKNITNAEVIKMLVVLKKDDLTADMVKESSWPASWINWASQEGIIGKEAGVEIKDFGAAASRQDAFLMLYNALVDAKAPEKTEAVKLDEVKEAKKVLKNFVDGLKLENFEIEGVKKPENEKAIADFKALIEKAKELLKKDDKAISKEELEIIKEMPTYKIGDKKHKGDFAKAGRKILVDFEVLGDKSVKSDHSGKSYTKLDDKGIIKIKSSLKGASKAGQNPERYIKLNYVSEDDYNKIKNTDLVTGATPKYDKKEVPAENYEVRPTADGYEIEIKKLPEGAKIVKPIVYVKLGDMAFLENGTLVYVK